MNDADMLDRSRRLALGNGLRIAAIVVSVLTIGASKPVAAKTAKADMQYQDHRHDGKGCGECKFFTPASADADTGTCSVVEGAISRNGWCSAYTPNK